MVEAQWLGYTKASPPKADAKKLCPINGLSSFLLPLPGLHVRVNGGRDAAEEEEEQVVRLPTRTAPVG